MKRITNINRWHRMVLVFGAAAILALAFAIKAMAQSSVPNLINFQGILRDGSGNPVADGSHNLTFRIFDGDITEPGATLLWTEGPLGITTSGGLFNHRLGSIEALPQTLFQDNDRLYLEIEADGETLSPRTPLISNPYTRMTAAATLAQDLTCNGCVTNAEIATDAVGADEIADGAVVGGLGGDIADGTVDGKDIGDESVGSSEIANESVGSAEIGPDAVGSSEIGANAVGTSEVADGSLMAADLADEPGVVHNLKILNVSLDNTYKTLVACTVSVPASGYVLVIGTGEFFCGHSNGAEDVADIGVSDVAGSFPSGHQMQVRVASAAPTGSYSQVATVHGLFSVSVGVSTFYFIGHEAIGQVTAAGTKLSLIYFPSAYGTVVPTVLSAIENLPDEKAQSVSALLPEATIELAAAPTPDPAALQRELAEIKARMQKLEEQFQQNQQTVENEQ